MRLQTNWLSALLLLCLFSLNSACSLFKKKIPDIEMCYNLKVGGYGGCSTTLSNKQHILPPLVWAEMKDGPGYWVMPKALEELRIFVLEMCMATNQCSAEQKREIDKKFEFVLESPAILEGKKESK